MTDEMMDFISTEFKIQQSRMFKAMPCIITNIPNDMTDLRIDVQPAINMLYTDGSSEERPQILSVPVIMPGSTTSMINIPLRVGDTVMCVFCSRSMDNFKIGNGQPTTPNNSRKFSAQDAVAIPGLFPFAKSVNNPSIHKFAHNTQDLTIKHNIGTGTEVEIRISPTGMITINTDQDFTINCRKFTLNAKEGMTFNSPVTGWNGAITQIGDYTQNGIYKLGNVTMNTHVHPGVQTGPGSTQGPK